MKKGFIFLGLILALSSVTIAAAGQGKASVYIVHGVPGADAGAADTPFFPVDILINDVLVIRNLELGAVAGPFAFEPSPVTYTLSIRRANPLDPGTGDPVLEVTGLAFGGEKTYSVVVHLKADGSEVTASVFENVFGPVSRIRPGSAGRNKPRIIIHQTAAVGPVDIRVSRENPGSGGGPRLEVAEIENDGESQVTADLLPGSWIMWIGLHQTGQRLYGPWQIELRPFTTYLVYAIGSVDHGTFWLIKHPVGVHPQVGLRGKDAKQAASSPRTVIKRTFRRY